MMKSILRAKTLLLGLAATAVALPTSLQGQVPEAPTNVVARVLPAEILFTWDPVPGADYYQIFSGGPNKRWIPLAPTTNTVFHEGDFTDLPSFYRVAAFNSAGQVWQTPDLLISNIPNTLTISHHVVRSLSDSAAAIGWAVTGGPADGVLEVGAGSSEPFFLAIDPGFQAIHELVVTNLVPGTTYWFRLTSADANRGGTIYRNTFTHQPIAPPPPVQVELFPPVAASFWVRDDAILPVQLTANNPRAARVSSRSPNHRQLEA